MRNLFLVILLISVTNLSISDDLFTTSEYGEIGEYQLSEGEISENELKRISKLLENSEDPLDQVITKIDKLIALGEKIWAIVEKGKPVIRTTFTPSVSVLPGIKNENGRATFDQMENWEAPQFKKFNVVYKNGYGMKVVKFSFIVSFQYGGSYNGQGLYLNALNVIATNISVAWGFNFDASSSLITISNRGTTDNPVAGATMQITHKVVSPVKEVMSAIIFDVDGRGNISIAD